MKILFKQIDAFTKVPFGGNPAGVVLDASGLSSETKVKIAREINASETAFVSHSSVADFRFQFFTPAAEVDMCGHATIATFFAMADEGKLDLTKDVFRIETNAGILPVEVSSVGGEKIFLLTLATPQFQKIDASKKDVAALLGLQEDDLLDQPAMNVYTGIWWTVFGVKKLEKLMTAKPDLKAIEKFSEKFATTGITPFCLETLDAQKSYHLRAIAPLVGVVEDPVCGTGNGCVASYIAHNHLVEFQEQIDLIGEQGMEVNRPGCVYVNVHKTNNQVDRTKIGGTAMTVLEGSLNF